MRLLVIEIAEYLASQGLCRYGGDDGDTFIAWLPSSPEEAIALYPLPGPQSDGRLGYDSPMFQVLVRGTADPRTGYDRASAIYNALHGLHGITLPHGTWLVGMWGVQSSPAHIGTDQTGHHEWTTTFRAEVRNQSPNRE